MQAPPLNYWNQINQNRLLALKEFSRWLDSCKVNVGWQSFFNKNVRFVAIGFIDLKKKHI